MRWGIISVLWWRFTPPLTLSLPRPHHGGDSINESLKVVPRPPPGPCLAWCREKFSWLIVATFQWYLSNNSRTFFTIWWWLSSCPPVSRTVTPLLQSRASSHLVANLHSLPFRAWLLVSGFDNYFNNLWHFRVGKIIIIPFLSNSPASPACDDQLAPWRPAIGENEIWMFSMSSWKTFSDENNQNEKCSVEMWCWKKLWWSLCLHH